MASQAPHQHRLGRRPVVPLGRVVENVIQFETAVAVGDEFPGALDDRGVLVVVAAIENQALACRPGPPLQHRPQAPAVETREGRRIAARHLDERRKHVRQGDRIDAGAARPDPTRPRGDEGHPRAALEQRGGADLRSPQRRPLEITALVAREQEERVLPQAEFPQRPPDAADRVVERPHHAVVLGHLVREAPRPGLGNVVGPADHRCMHAIIPQVEKEAAAGVGPEERDGIVGLPVGEIGAGGHVGVNRVGPEGGQMADHQPAIGGPDLLVEPPVDRVLALVPEVPLAMVRRVVAEAPQGMTEGLRAGRQPVARRQAGGIVDRRREFATLGIAFRQVPDHAQRGRVPARHEAGAAGAAGGRRRVGPAEHHAARREGIDVRSPVMGSLIPDLRPAEVVDEENHEVGRAARRASGGQQAPTQQKRDPEQSAQHGGGRRRVATQTAAIRRRRGS